MFSAIHETYVEILMWPVSRSGNTLPLYDLLVHCCCSLFYGASGVFKLYLDFMLFSSSCFLSTSTRLKALFD